jgi:hypothetical protein
MMQFLIVLGIAIPIVVAVAVVFRVFKFCQWLIERTGDPRSIDFVTPLIRELRGFFRHIQESSEKDNKSQKDTPQGINKADNQAATVTETADPVLEKAMESDSNVES